MTTATMRLDETLFGRIAVFNKYITRSQLEECLALQRRENPSRRIGDILLEKGYIDETQLSLILEIRRKKLKRMVRNQEELCRNERAFGRLALLRGKVSLSQLEDCILEQEKLAHLNLQFRIGEVMVAKGVLSVEDVLEILSWQKKRILACPPCDLNYNVVNYEEGTGYLCQKCGRALENPRFLDSVEVDGVIGGTE